MKLVNKIAFILLIIGGLNWGLFVFDMDLVAMLPGPIDTIVYILVALSAVLVIFSGYKGKTESVSETSDEPEQPSMENPTM